MDETRLAGNERLEDPNGEVELLGEACRRHARPEGSRLVESGDLIHGPIGEP